MQRERSPMHRKRVCVCLCVCLCAAVQGNNEVSMWDLETGDRKFTLWASSAPPLSEMQVGGAVEAAASQLVCVVALLCVCVCALQPSPHSVHGIYCSPADGNPLLLTAGSDMRIRSDNTTTQRHNNTNSSFLSEF